MSQLQNIIHMEAVATYTKTDILSEAKAIRRNFILNFARDGITIDPSKRVKISLEERFGIAFENIQTIVEQMKTNDMIWDSIKYCLVGLQHVVISVTGRNLPQMTEIGKLNALVVSSSNFHPQF